MAITLVPMTCPQCGATIEVPVAQDECFCTYCGTRILINNDNVKTININKSVTKTKRDEAKLAEVEHKKLKVKVVAGVAGAILLALMILVILSIVGNTNAFTILALLFFTVIIII